MQKTKLVFISMLSILIVLVPFSSALACSKPPNKPQKQTVKVDQRSKQNKEINSTFKKLEEKGSKEVDIETLEEAEGEGFLGGLVSTAVGAVAGAVAGGVGYVVGRAISGKRMSWAGATKAVAKGSSTGATAAAVTYAFPSF